jgi:hypothetical protein
MAMIPGCTQIPVVTWGFIQLMHAPLPRVANIRGTKVIVIAVRPLGAYTGTFGTSIHESAEIAIVT